MTSIDHSAAWRALASHHNEMFGARMDEAFERDPERAQRFSLRLDDLLLDYSKNLINTDTVRLLRELARAADLAGWTRKFFAGEHVNTAENRPALHMVLRQPEGSLMVGGKDVAADARAVRERMRAFATSVRDGSRRGSGGAAFTHAIHIGIGGSHLGPQLVVDALRPRTKASGLLDVRFASGLDDAQLSEALNGLDPATTLALVVSKSWTTAETQANTRLVRDWLRHGLGDDAKVGQHVVAVTSRPDLAREIGMKDDAIFPMWDWVGGRYSLWSAVGLPILLGCGVEAFDALLAGAHRMDEHFRTAPIDQNMPATLGLLGVWYQNFYNTPTEAVLPYDWKLKYLPAWLQQVNMESNGKSVDRDGKPTPFRTGPIVWGGLGNDGQHAFFQLMHQGTRLIPADFIAAAEGGTNRDALMANMFAQAEALMRGTGKVEQGKDYRFSPGNRPSNTIMMRRLDARTLGMLLALYEHKVFVQGVLWGINSFDQWGVELGKTLAAKIEPELKGGGSAPHDASTTALMAQYKEWR